MKKFLFYFFISFLICVSLIYFISNKNTDNQDYTNFLKLGNAEDPKTLDPAFSTTVSEQKILNALFEGLLKFDPETMQIKEALSSLPKISEDGLTYTFNISKDAKFSNGKPLKIDDFIFSYKRILHPKSLSLYDFIFYPIKNAKKYKNSEILDFSEVGIKKINESTLQITLEEKTPYFLSLVCHFSFFPVSQEQVERFGDAFSPSNAWAKPENFVSNGAFKIKQWSLLDKIVLEKNPFYYKNNAQKLDKKYIDGIIFYPADGQTEIRAFLANQLDVTESLVSSKIEYMKKNDPSSIRISPWLGVYFYAFNTQKPPFDNPKFRKALSICLDRKSICKKILKDTRFAAYSLVPLGTSNHIAPVSIKENIDLAKELINEIYPNKEDLPKIQIIFRTSEINKPIAEYIKYFWQENLGIKVDLINMSQQALLSARSSGDFQIIVAGWIGDYNDPLTFLDMWQSFSSLNYASWENQDFDNLLVLAKENGSNPKKRSLLLSEAEQIILDQMPIIPIYFNTRVNLVKQNVKNYHSNILDIQSWQDIYFSNENPNDKKTNNKQIKK